VFFIYPPDIQDLNILNTYTILMGFLDKLKRGLAGGKEKAENAGKDVEHGAEKVGKDVEHGAEKVGKDVEHGAEKVGKDVEHGAEKVVDDKEEKT
jgi:predicted small secreted protein